MPPTGFEHTIPESERPQTHALVRAATGIGLICTYIFRFVHHKSHVAWPGIEPPRLDGGRQVTVWAILIAKCDGAWSNKLYTLTVNPR
jgi:hypothetical protein